MKKLTISQDTLFFSLKYALTRRSNAPVLVSSDIIKNINDIEDEYLNKMIIELSKKEFPEELNELWVSLRKDLEHEKMVREAAWLKVELD